MIPLYGGPMEFQSIYHVAIKGMNSEEYHRDEETEPYYPISG